MRDDVDGPMFMAPVQSKGIYPTGPNGEVGGPRESRDEKDSPWATGDKAGSPFMRPEGPNGEAGGPRKN